MGRKVLIRVNYRHDAVFLSRLSEAIQNDDKRSIEWRQQAIGHLNSLGMMFLEDANRAELPPLTQSTQEADDKGDGYANRAELPPLTQSTQEADDKGDG